VAGRPRGPRARGLLLPHDGPHEIGRACGFDVDFNDHKGTFKVWGSARDQVDGFGNAVFPAIPMWIGTRLRAVLHGEAVA
jgi:DNA (cytosine-5)-methyltransferase 1